MLAENITAFVANLTYEKHLSAHTITAYQADLEQFSKYLSDTYEVNQVSSVNHQLIKSWMVLGRCRGLAGGTTGRRLGRTTDLLIEVPVIVDVHAEPLGDGLVGARDDPGQVCPAMELVED